MKNRMDKNLGINMIPLFFPAFLTLILMAAFVFPDTGLALGKWFRLNNESTAADNVFPLADGYIVLSNHGTKQNLTKLDLNGSVVSTKDFLDLANVPTVDLGTIVGTGGWPIYSIKTSDGGYLVSGLIDPRPQKGFLVKLDSNLSFVWGKVITHSNTTLDAWMGGVRETSDGKYLVQVKGQYATPFSSEPFVGVIKLNTDGSVVWNKRIKTGYQNEVFDIIETANAYIAYGALNINPGDSYDWHLFFAGIKKDGNAYTFPGTGLNNSGSIFGGSAFDGAYEIGTVIYPVASNMVQLDSNNLAVAAYTRSYGVNPGADVAHPTVGKSVLVLRFNLSDGFVDKGVYLDGPLDDEVAGPYGGPNFIKLSDGNLLLGGTTTSTWSGSWSGPFLVKLQPDFLGIIWQNAYTPYVISGSTYTGTTGGFFSVAETPTHEIAATGKTGGSDTDGLFAVVAADGSGDEACFMPSSTQFALNPLPGYTYNNPIDCTNSGVCVDVGLIAFHDISPAPSPSTPSVNLVCFPHSTASPSGSLYPFSALMIMNSSAPVLFTVTNDASCNGVLALPQLPFFTGGDSGEFQVTPVDCPYLSMFPGEYCSFNVTFSPSSVGSKSTTLRILSNDPATPARDITLTGTAEPCGYQPVKVGSTLYTSISLGYGAAQDGDEIKLFATDITESPNFNPNPPISVALEGGYDCGFAGNAGYSTIHGAVTISRGLVRVDRIIIK